MSWYGNAPTRSWDPKAAKALTLAYHDALARAGKLGILKDDRETASHLIARHIMKRAQSGICDPQVLADRALQHLQNHR